MHATMNRGVEKKRSRRDNLVLGAGAVLLLVFILISYHLKLAGKWNTVAFGTFVPFVVVVQTYPRRWRHGSFWFALTVCLVPHLAAMWLLFRYTFVYRAPGWVLWIPLVFVESFVLMLVVPYIESRLTGKHSRIASL